MESTVRFFGFLAIISITLTVMGLVALFTGSIGVGFVFLLLGIPGLIFLVVGIKNTIQRSKYVGQMQELTKDTMKFDATSETLKLYKRDFNNSSLLDIESLRYSSLKYTPPEAVYTGATVGGVHMGGVHINEEYYTLQRGGATGRYKIYYVGAVGPDDSRYVRRIELSSELVKSAKSHTVGRFLTGNTLVLEYPPDPISLEVAQEYYQRAALENRKDISYTANMMLDAETSLTKEDCEVVLGWIAGKD